MLAPPLLCRNQRPSQYSGQRRESSVGLRVVAVDRAVHDVMPSSIAYGHSEVGSPP